ncbi:MAG: hypothetical protein HYU39_02805 [Thaumarchaeota archaeon]|nr:hypothetical protein [Nitrososphaerota archaeon]
MKGRIFLIHWNQSEADEFAEKLRSEGWKVDIEAEDGARAGKMIRADPPDAVVIYLTRLPSHGRETADYLRSVKTTRNIPIVFVDGREDALEKTKVKVADAVFTTSTELKNVLANISKLS